MNITVVLESTGSVLWIYLDRKRNMIMYLLNIKRTKSGFDQLWSRTCTLKQYKVNKIYHRPPMIN